MQETYSFQEEFQQEFDNFNNDNNQELFFSKYQEETSQQGIKIYRCLFPECDKTFKFKSEITRHIAIHSSNRPFHCKKKGCNKSFKRLDALENHERIHTKATPFYCSFSGCREKFTTQAGLRYHLMKHKDVRAYKCELPSCDKSFITASHLRQHQRTSVLHNKDRSNKRPQENNCGSVEFSQDQSQIEVKEKCINMSETGQTEPSKFVYDEEDFKLFLNRIREENKKLDQRLELWQEHCQFANNDINQISPAGSPAGHQFQNEFDLVSNDSATNSSIFEFYQWCDEYSFKERDNPIESKHH